MAFWNRQSTVDKILDFMRAERESNVRLQEASIRAQEALVAATVEQAKVVQGYLKLFTDAPKPEIRVMTDIDEADVEARLKAKRERDDRAMSAQIPVISPEDWMSDMSKAFDAMKQEIQ